MALSELQPISTTQISEQKFAEQTHKLGTREVPPEIKLHLKSILEKQDGSSLPFSINHEEGKYIITFGYKDETNSFKELDLFEIGRSQTIRTLRENGETVHVFDQVPTSSGGAMNLPSVEREIQLHTNEFIQTDEGHDIIIIDTDHGRYLNAQAIFSLSFQGKCYRVSLPFQGTIQEVPRKGWGKLWGTSKRCTGGKVNHKFISFDEVVLQ